MKEMQSQIAQIQKVLTELQGQPQQRKYKAIAAKAMAAPLEVTASHHLKAMTMMRRKDCSERPRQRPGRRLYVNRLME
jgi:hypothetical protein